MALEADVVVDVDVAGAEAMCISFSNPLSIWPTLFHTQTVTNTSLSTKLSNSDNPTSHTFAFRATHMLFLTF